MTNFLKIVSFFSFTFALFHAVNAINVTETGLAILEKLEIDTCVSFLQHNNRTADDDSSHIKYYDEIFHDIESIYEYLREFEEVYLSNPQLLQIMEKLLQVKRSVLDKRLLRLHEIKDEVIRIKKALRMAITHPPAHYSNFTIRNWKLTNEDGPDEEASLWIVDMIAKDIEKDDLAKNGQKPRFTKQIQLFSEGAYVFTFIALFVGKCPFYLPLLCSIIFMFGAIGVILWVLHVIKILFDFGIIF
ncbi:uncharacterized protein NDAI_0A06310 [Naumovozyma dairenensis CBS 421]|uniref:Uncharacterized protein n=1 Tax=Naumovozyma dairenensis (strain ATCC 10597 / BCRC 20456 / CBS 421 / NBRC 0211 / NRRL Y-12639) TaxID=1071378 RepID=G0W4P7_NAUDC|nr:hypothetical protein NDAI_0A06310 [Naumovozyma dairenensis CBS 421]CCD22785.1 hypothetical protein NDAI_0A06310 [Naumovozyma dairenensis CBS 421]